MSLEKNQTTTIKNLISVFPEKRKTGFNNLIRLIPQIDPQNYKKISYGLFYYYWWSDGYINQEKDCEAISNLGNLLDDEKRLKLTKSIFEVFVQLWSKIDYHRTNKFLKLCKDVFLAFYKFLGDKDKKLISDWNGFLIKEVFFAKNSKGLLLEYLFILKDLFVNFKPKNIFYFFLFFKPLLDLLAFKEDKAIRKKITDIYIPFLLQKIMNFEKKKLLRFQKYVCNYIENKNIKENFALNFCEINDFIKNFISIKIDKIIPIKVDNTLEKQKEKIAKKTESKIEIENENEKIIPKVQRKSNRKKLIKFDELGIKINEAKPSNGNHKKDLKTDTKKKVSSCGCCKPKEKVVVAKREKSHSSSDINGKNKNKKELNKEKKNQKENNNKIEQKLEELEEEDLDDLDYDLNIDNLEEELGIEKLENNQNNSEENNFKNSKEENFENLEEEILENMENSKEENSNEKMNIEIEDNFPEDFINIENVENGNLENYVHLNGDQFLDDGVLIDEFGNEIGKFDEEYFDPWENLSESEMRARMPPYWFKTGKKKKKFFQNMSKKYKKRLYDISAKRSHNNRKKIIFKLDKNQVKTFKKTLKVSFN